MRLQSPLKSTRLILDNLDAAALPSQYLAWINNREITRYMEIRFRTQTADELADFVANMNESGDNLLLGVFLKQDRRYIGNIKLGPIIAPHRRADMGLFIGDDALWGKGYATEAIELLTAHALGPLGLHRVTAGMYTGNVGSYRAFLKAGYTEDGRLREYWLSDGCWQDEIVLCKLAGSTRE